MNRDLRWMAAGTAGLALLLVVAIAGVVRVAWYAGCSASRAPPA